MFFEITLNKGYPIKSLGIPFCTTKIGLNWTCLSTLIYLLNIIFTRWYVLLQLPSKTPQRSFTHLSDCFLKTICTLHGVCLNEIE